MFWQGVQLWHFQCKSQMVITTVLLYYRAQLWCKKIALSDQNMSSWFKLLHIIVQRIGILSQDSFMSFSSLFNLFQVESISVNRIEAVGMTNLRFPRCVNAYKMISHGSDSGNPLNPQRFVNNRLTISTISHDILSGCLVSFPTNFS